MKTDFTVDLIYWFTKAHPNNIYYIIAWLASCILHHFSYRLPTQVMELTQQKCTKLLSESITNNCCNSKAICVLYNKVKQAIIAHNIAT